MSRTRRLFVLSALLTSACGAGWRSLPTLEPGPLRPRQQAQIWERGTSHRVHGVLIGADSVSAVPFHRPPNCDSCRITLPLSVVDSVRVGSPVAGFWKTFALVSLMLGAACARWCIQPGN